MSLINAAKLLNRKIIKINGPDSCIYLQGLVCNDVRLLYQPPKVSSIGAFMTNQLGRALCDMIIYRTPRTKLALQDDGSDELYIECDASIANSLVRTLTAYRVKRKVELTTEDNLNVWSIWKPITDLVAPSLLTLGTKETINDKYILTCDPRLTNLGLRILTPEHEFKAIKNELKLPDDNYKEVSHLNYVAHRYKLGVGEGHLDILETRSFPLECNADYLNSVSFTKGCYLGQELTARIHHTGIVRKRLMPIMIDTTNGESYLPPGTDIVDETDTVVGRIISMQGVRGLALMRVEQTIKSKSLKHKQTGAKLTTHVPFWWPS